MFVCMTPKFLHPLFSWSFLVSVIIIFLFSCLVPHSFAAGGALDPLLGSWGGMGNYTLQDGMSEKIKCDAYYSGGKGQLSMVVRCLGANNKIEMRSVLSSNGKSLTGSWEERTYNAEGNVTGEATADKLSLAISGGITGSMVVSYRPSSQNISILTEGSALKAVNINLSRK